jgi:flagellar operon protein
MANPKINNILIPNITKLTPKQSIDTSNKLAKGETSEFKSLLDSNLEQSGQSSVTDFPKGLHLSTHAMKRLQERNLSIDKEEYSKILSAIDKLKLKGGQDSLVITSKAAYIIDVPKNMIVTAIDKESVGDNVFTKIDSTILMN